jgi:phosphonate transport system permease protein
MAIVIALPIAFLAARNTTPSVTVVRPIALLIIVSSRSINSLIWALLPTRN